MSFSQRLQDVRTGFERPFWVANISELFERLSYYAAFASLARYLHEALSFPTERAAHENVRSIGYSIYYTLVNIGGFIGPWVASWVHKNLSVENVFRVAAISVFAMFFGVLLFFKEPRQEAGYQTASVLATLR